MIENLLVTHRLKSPESSALGIKMQSLWFDTCLREVIIELLPDHGSKMPANDETETLHGADAYRLLLEIATGLRSAIPGETNVFGQFRRAWQTFLDHGHPTIADGLTPVISQLFDDTKTVRRNWLEGIGGTSYGSLVRRLIEPRGQDHVLFVGSGDLMRSMLPLFGKFRLGIWNHRNIKPMATNIKNIFPPGQGRQAAAWADHVILTTPRDSQTDRNWHTWLRNARPRTVVHLGHRQSGWALSLDREPGISAFDLDDVFALRRELDDYRSKKLDRARMACAYLANLRLESSDADLIAA